MKWLILLHVLGATIWVGGHLILSITFLPKTLREKDVMIIKNFEQHFERVGLPAFALAVHVRFFIFPKVENENLSSLVFHIILVTVLAVTFVVVGLSFRFNFI